LLKDAIEQRAAAREMDAPPDFPELFRRSRAGRLHRPRDMLKDALERSRSQAEAHRDSLEPMELGCFLAKGHAVPSRPRAAVRSWRTSMNAFASTARPFWS